MFAWTCQQIAKMLQVRNEFCLKHGRRLTKSKEYDRDLNFATDAWTSPNHQAFVAVAVHLKQNGVPLCFILDVIEVAQVMELHTGCLYANYDPRSCSPTLATTWQKALQTS